MLANILIFKEPPIQNRSNVVINLIMWILFFVEPMLLVLFCASNNIFPVNFTAIGSSHMVYQKKQSNCRQFNLAFINSLRWQYKNIENEFNWKCSNYENVIFSPTEYLRLLSSLLSFVSSFGHQWATLSINQKKSDGNYDEYEANESRENNVFVIQTFVDCFFLASFHCQHEKEIFWLFSIIFVSFVGVKIIITKRK